MIRSVCSIVIQSHHSPMSDPQWMPPECLAFGRAATDRYGTTAGATAPATADSVGAASPPIADSFGAGSFATGDSVCARATLIERLNTTTDSLRIEMVFSDVQI